MLLIIRYIIKLKMCIQSYERFLIFENGKKVERIERVEAVEIL
jgi:hypothetical protein